MIGTNSNTPAPLNLHLIRVRCNTPIQGLKYAQRHKATGLVEVSAFSAHCVLTGFPEHQDPVNPSLGELVALVEGWNEVQTEWEYTLNLGSANAH